MFHFLERFVELRPIVQNDLVSYIGHMAQTPLSTTLKENES